MTRRRTGAFAISAVVHATVAAMLVITARPPKPVSHDGARDGSSAPQSMPVFVVQPASRSLPGLRASDDADDRSDLSDSGRPLLSIPGLTLNFKKVAARANLLFPPITPGLALEQFLPVGTRRSPGLTNPLATLHESEPDNLPPLLVGASERQALVDKSWSRHERWRAFQNLAPTVGRYSANDGDIPRILQMYFEQNGLQPFVDAGAHDQRVWAQLCIAADHVDFIGFISRYASARPASRATTSLLLVLDTLIQSNLDVLVTLLSIDPVADLQLTQRANRAAYDFIVETRRHYKEELLKKRLPTLDSVKTYYDAIRLAVLDTVVRTTPAGYRAGDARYLMGAIYWRQGNVDAAVNQWRAISRDESDSYAFVYLPILRALDGGANSAAAQATIERALGAERSQWRSLSYDRLSKFGYRFDTF
jgi:hypothetical protein